MTQSLLKIIDPHLHLFNLQQGDYQWLKPQNPPFWPDKKRINRNFIEKDLCLPVPIHLAGFVHVEAGFDNQQPWREIDWLQQHCTLPFKSVAFADLTTHVFEEHLRQLQQRSTVVGIRHILDEQAQAILSSHLIDRHFALLADTNFSFDAQLSLSDTPALDLLVAVANRHKSLRIIINHAGWPPSDTDKRAQEKWLTGLQKLAQCENIAMKLSGWEMSNRAWQPEQVAKLLRHCLSFFGDERIMLASNFPLCTFSMPYADLWNSYVTLPEISPQSLEKMAFNNAKTWYQF
ncbi:MAG: amidohydrolase family protein [Paraglaciecola sp.]|uniref:amidohydrolase family protein n=1 Tax=Paraglaciecola sp. TaxID=1920173 RepID=UPI0032980D60